MAKLCFLTKFAFYFSPLIPHIWSPQAYSDRICHFIKPLLTMRSHFANKLRRIAHPKIKILSNHLLTLKLFKPKLISSAQKMIFWTICVTKQLMDPIGWNTILWKSVGSINCLVNHYSSKYHLLCSVDRIFIFEWTIPLSNNVTHL